MAYGTKIRMTTICELNNHLIAETKVTKSGVRMGKKKEILPLVPVWEFYYVLRRGLEHCNYRHEWQRLMKTLRHVETGTLLYMGILHGQPAHSINNRNVKMSTRNQR